MCGRYSDTKRPEGLLKELGIYEAASFVPRFNIAPTQLAWVVFVDVAGTLVYKQMRWGFVPFWAQDTSIANKLINARAETVREKPAFRRSFQKKRCAVIADGFYEWKKEGAGKVPYYIGLKDEFCFFFAGLWDCWTGEGQLLETYCVLTTTANPFMEPIHHRMPVILDKNEVVRWLKPADEAGLANLLKSCDAELMQCHPVSTRVNNPKYDQPDCIERTHQVPPHHPQADPFKQKHAPIQTSLPLE